MPLTIPAGFGLLAYQWGLATDPEVMICTLGLAVDPLVSGPQVQLDEKADAMATAVPAAQLAGGYAFLGCTLRVGDGSGSTTVYEAPRNIVGTAGAVSLPNNCAYLVRKSTARAGRRGRGRMYLPPWIVAEADISNSGILTGAALTGLQAIVEDAFPLAGLVLLHDDLPAVLAPDSITALTVDRQIATQRRRLRS